MRANYLYASNGTMRLFELLVTLVGFEPVLATKVVSCTTGILVSVANVGAPCFIQDVY